MLRTITTAAIITILLFSGGKAMAACSANHPASPVINIEISENEPHFDTKQSAAQLASFHSDSTAAGNHIYHAGTGGLMSGTLTMRHQLKFTPIYRADIDMTCLAVKEINIALHLSPEIHIAREMHDNSCWFREIFEHELAHTEIDRRIMEKYRGRLKDALNMLLAAPEDYISPPAMALEIDAMAEKMHAEFARPLDVMFTAMLRERIDIQSKFDSRNEYARIARACRNAS